MAGVRILGGSAVFVDVKHFTFTFPKSVDFYKRSNVLFSFSLAITYETSGGEYVNYITLITYIQPPTEYVSNIILQLTVTNMARVRSLNDTHLKRQESEFNFFQIVNETTKIAHTNKPVW